MEKPLRDLSAVPRRELWYWDDMASLLRPMIIFRGEPKVVETFSSPIRHSNINYLYVVLFQANDPGIPNKWNGITTLVSY